MSCHFKEMSPVHGQKGLHVPIFLSFSCHLLWKHNNWWTHFVTFFHKNIDVTRLLSLIDVFVLTYYYNLQFTSWFIVFQQTQQHHNNIIRLETVLSNHFGCENTYWWSGLFNILQYSIKFKFCTTINMWKPHFLIPVLTL